LKNILRFCSISETTTALAIIFIPLVITKLLFDTEINDVTIVITRFAGISLLCFGIASWPKQEFVLASWAMLLYNLLVTILFIYLGLNQIWVGILLWPVAILHFVLAVLLVRGIFNEKQIKTR
jgi:hypothetical protein